MRTSPSLLLALLLSLPVVAAAQTPHTPVGEVTSISGDVRASGPGGDRALACGDPVFAGDTVTTGSDGSAGILMDDVHTQVDAASTMVVGQTPAGSADAQLESGRLRMIDARDGGAAARLGAGGAAVRVAGNDAEAYVLSEKVGPYAMFCEWDAPLAVSRGGEVQTADPEHCIIAKPSEPLYVSQAHEERIAAGGGEPCPPDLGGLVAPGPHFAPGDARDVAAGPPPAPWSSMASAQPMPTLQPCEDPGTGCASVDGIPTVIVEPPPSTDPQPGAGGFGGIP